MKVLIIGHGGREHAIGQKISESSHKPIIYAAQGNPGMKFAKRIDIDETDNQKLVEFAIAENIDLTIVGPELPLANGIVNCFQSHNLPIYGPTKEAAEIETSKGFAKEIMKKYRIPTAEFQIAQSFDEAIEIIQNRTFPIVLKYDGLAAGKGVTISYDYSGAARFISEIFRHYRFGKAPLVIEDYLEGIEFSLMAFVHGKNVYPMEIAQDHKRAYDFDQGPNTGGMGAYSPVPLIKAEDIEFSVEHIMKPVASALHNEGRSFKGILYGGLMKTKDGVKVIEFNARFGDPETEVILPRMKNDLLDVLLSIMQGKDPKLEWDNQYVLGTVLASAGYPGQYSKGAIIENIPDKDVIHMGTKEQSGMITVNGGRVLMALGKGNSLQEARDNAYLRASNIRCADLFFRNDIGEKSLNFLNLKK